MKAPIQAAMIVTLALAFTACAGMQSSSRKARNQGDVAEAVARAEAAAAAAEDAARKAETAAEKSEVIFHTGMQK